MTRTRTTAAVLAALALSLLTFSIPIAACARSKTLHVEVKETGGDQVNISVPIALAKAALHIAGKAQVEIADDDIPVTEIRKAWAGIRESGEKVVVDVKSEDGESVHITNENGYVTIDVDEGRSGGKASRETVKIAIPEAAVDALLSGEGDALDVGAALSALAATHTGNVVEVDDGRDYVRIWID